MDGRKAICRRRAITVHFVYRDSTGHACHNYWCSRLNAWTSYLVVDEWRGDEMSGPRDIGGPLNSLGWRQFIELPHSRIPNVLLIHGHGPPAEWTSRVVFSPSAINAPPKNSHGLGYIHPYEQGCASFCRRGGVAFSGASELTATSRPLHPLRTAAHPWRRHPLVVARDRRGRDRGPGRRPGARAPPRPREGAIMLVSGLRCSSERSSGSVSRQPVCTVPPPSSGECSASKCTSSRRKPVAASRASLTTARRTVLRWKTAVLLVETMRHCGCPLRGPPLLGSRMSTPPPAAAVKSGASVSSSTHGWRSHSRHSRHAPRAGGPAPVGVGPAKQNGQSGNVRSLTLCEQLERAHEGAPAAGAEAVRAADRQVEDLLGARVVEPRGAEAHEQHVLAREARAAERPAVALGAPRELGLEERVHRGDAPREVAELGLERREPVRDDVILRRSAARDEVARALDLGAHARQHEVAVDAQVALQSTRPSGVGAAGGPARPSRTGAARRCGCARGSTRRCRCPRPPCARSARPPRGAAAAPSSRSLEPRARRQPLADAQLAERGRVLGRRAIAAAVIAAGPPPPPSPSEVARAAHDGGVEHLEKRRRRAARRSSRSARLAAALGRERDVGHLDVASRRDGRGRSAGTPSRTAATSPAARSPANSPTGVIGGWSP